VKKVNVGDVKEQYQTQTAGRFAVLENLDDTVVINRT